jgi:hypothetical protein
MKLTPVGAYANTPYKSIQDLVALAAHRAASGEHRTLIIQDLVDGYNLGWQSANHRLIEQAATTPLDPTIPRITLRATADSPITLYYCKAGIQSGQTIRVLQDKIVHSCSGITLSSTLLGGPFAAAMTHDNAKGKPKASGARCVLTINNGGVTLIP